jgi:predicted NAD-dependent protein-ADP-ribosyltransferase YbiA (DUF1768 family)
MPVTAITSFKSEYSFLSLEYPYRIDFRGDLYPTLLHAFLAARATNSMDRTYIRRNSSTAKALKRGFKVAWRADWDVVEYQTLLVLTRVKFPPGTKLAAKLLDTGDAELVEGKVGITQFLGPVLMKVRADLREQIREAA